ncbi:MAG TPA: M3 family metallopeptidase [Lacunisphaera sp.]|nr:M3 family metallopeptidase [Lacunisphaera sp.]
MDNPFLDRHFHIRWSRLKPDLVGPAIDAALAGADTALAAITKVDPASADYRNVFLALEDATDLLNETWAKVTHLTTVADSPELRAAHNAALPKVSAFQARVPLNAELWDRLKVAAARPLPAELRAEHRRFRDETLADFRQQGADLPAEKKVRLEALQSELAALTQKYSENVLDATNGWELVVTDAARLRGLPDHAREAARQSALKKGRGTAAEPAWRFTLHQPSQEPVMLYAEDESLRREVWQAAVLVGRNAPQANPDLVKKILFLRQEKAALLGQPHFADLVLSRRMAKHGAQARSFLDELHRLVQPAFIRECRELEEFKARHAGGSVARLAPWEVAFWAEKLRRERYDFDEEQLRPYFPLPGVQAGLFDIARRVFGPRVTELPAGAVETWHPEVKFHEVHDAAGRHLGSFYADWHPRESKRGGAWMNYLITGGPRPDGSRAPHLGLICGNLTPPNAGQPALLTHREVQTIFHEFGHLLHHLLGEVEIKSLNGVNVAWDFVELPSQLMENWCWERESLDVFARHYQTGAPIPDALYQRMVAARNFRSATATMRQLGLARLDLDLHMQPVEAMGDDLSAWLTARLRDHLLPTEPASPTIENRFTHIFADPVGYAAGYYSYKWAEVLDADAFTRFKREGIFNGAVGGEFVAKVLSRGNGAEPMELFVDFMGRPPDQRALLVRAGLAGL